jgi:hypothetical protein
MVEDLTKVLDRLAELLTAKTAEAAADRWSSSECCLFLGIGSAEAGIDPKGGQTGRSQQLFEMVYKGTAAAEDEGVGRICAERS